jgi:hypothetical protein
MKRKIVLDAEELQILMDFENGVFVKDTVTDLKLHAEYARNTLKLIKESATPSSVEDTSALATCIPATPNYAGDLTPSAP